MIKRIQTDLSYLYRYWMSQIFPNQFEKHSVMGYWSPKTTKQKIGWNIWSFIGIFAIGITYMTILVGYTLIQTKYLLQSIIYTLGIKVSAVLLLILWGGTGIIISPDRTIGLLGGLGFGLICLGIAGVGHKLQRKTILYPAILNAILVPPTILALFSDYISQIVFPYSNTVAIYLLQYIFEPIGLREIINANFSLEGIGLVVFWILSSIVIGWILALLVEITERFVKSIQKQNKNKN